MSKDIWHKPSETTDVDNNLIIDDWTNGTYELGYFDDKDMVFRNFRNDDIHDEESMMRWCDVDELIDDYNRTRKALETGNKDLSDKIGKLETELDRTRKALDVAKDKLDTVRQYHRGTAVIRPDDIAAYCDKAIEQITALEQKE